MSEDDPANINVQSELEAAFDEATSYEQLQAAHLRVLRQYEKLKTSKLELREAVYQAAFDAAAGLKIGSVKKPLADKRKKAEEVCVPLISDLQLAKVTPDYNTDVAEERMRLYAQKIVEITEIQRSDHPVRKVVCCVLGDIIEGIDIFPGQAWLVDAGLYRQIMVDGPRIMVEFFQTLLANFDTVEVHWVIGNHGRIGRKGTFDPESNGDRMLGKLLEMHFRNEKRISFVVPDGKGERNWYDVCQIGNYSALLIHGDQIRGHSGFPWYGLGKKVNGWASGAIRTPFQDVFMGHFHQRSLIPLNKRDVYVNGSTESYNTYAEENLAAMSDPSQWLLYVNPDKGNVSASYGVRLN